MRFNAALRLSWQTSSDLPAASVLQLDLALEVVFTADLALGVPEQEVVPGLLTGVRLAWANLRPVSRVPPPG